MMESGNRKRRFFGSFFQKKNGDSSFSEEKEAKRLLCLGAGRPDCFLAARFF
jgi:hypothetical protein